MCGIAGFIGERQPELLNKMGERIAHRGPDQHGRFEDDCFSAIHARLAIIDLSEAGRQPLYSADGRYLLLYNGEIYNYEERRRVYEARGYSFRTQTDSEVLLASMELAQLADLHELHGMFAFVVWDRQERILYASRDHLGIKPLYYAVRGSTLAFASEIKALLVWTGSCRVEPISQRQYVAFGFIPEERTIFEGILAFPPGKLGIWQGSAWIWKEYDQSTSQQQVTPLDVLRDRVCESVRRQLISDRPVGLFLSGGWDSTVVAWAARTVSPATPFHSYTVRFAHQTNDPKFNQDADIARITAHSFGLHHQEVLLQGTEVAERALEIAYSLDQPNANHSVYALSAAAQRASQDVSVILSGDGGDELFGGYERYKYARRFGAWLHLPFSLRQSLVEMTKSVPWVQAHMDQLLAKNVQEFFCSFHAIPRDFQRSWFPGLEGQEIFSGNRPVASRAYEKDIVAMFMDFDRDVWLRSDAFLRADRLTMKHGLELRVPLLDDILLSWAVSQPGFQHVSLLNSKRLWKKAFHDVVPKAVRQLPKRGWFPPTAKWIRAELRPWFETLLEMAFARHDWMDAEVIREAYKAHLEHRGYYLNELWRVVAYDLWYEAYASYLKD